MVLRFQNVKDFKYYLYISDAKVDMLYDQVPRAKSHHTSIEWKVDLKILSAVRKAESEQRDTRDTRLRSIIAALEESETIGTVDQPREYFRGKLRMRWGMYQDSGRPEDAAPLVYFGGRTRKTIFGLGGSSRHVLGFQGANSTGSRSSTPYLVARLLEGLDIDPRGWDSFRDGEPATEDDVMVAVASATYTLKQPDQELEFVAKTLLKGNVRHGIYTDDRRVNCVLGTPLYVAMVSPGMNDRL